LKHREYDPTRTEAEATPASVCMLESEGWEWVDGWADGRC